MASAHDHTFHEQSRIGDDRSGLSQKNIQNSHASKYMLDNLRSDCPMSKAIELATSQPSINYKGSHSVGINGCNIDKNSDLSIREISRAHCKLTLQERPFLTVPYLGKGKSNPVLESRLVQGDLANNRKSANPSSELCHMDYRNTPMIPSIKNTITNPKHLCEGDAADGWVRGGVPSRDLTRDVFNRQ